MNQQEKIKIVDTLASSLTDSKNIYFTEISGLDAQQTSNLRRMCFEKGVSLSVVKNTLLKKAMDACDKDFSEFYDLLKGNTTLMTSEVSNAPAKVIKNFLEKEKFSPESYKKIILKGGHVEASIYLGHEQLDILIALKSKEELLGDVITLLQSPIKNLLSSIGSAKQSLSGLLNSLESHSNSGDNKNPKSKEENTVEGESATEDSATDNAATEESVTDNAVKEESDVDKKNDDNDMQSKN